MEIKGGLEDPHQGNLVSKLMTRTVALMNMVMSLQTGKRTGPGVMTAVVAIIVIEVEEISAVMTEVSLVVQQVVSLSCLHQMMEEETVNLVKVVQHY